MVVLWVTHRPVSELPWKYASTGEGIPVIVNIGIGVLDIDVVQRNPFQNVVGTDGEGSETMV